MFGRKYIYEFEVLVLGAGAIASAFSPSIWWLVAFRFILGLGIGGDYPVSASTYAMLIGFTDPAHLMHDVTAKQREAMVEPEGL